MRVEPVIGYAAFPADSDDAAVLMARRRPRPTHAARHGRIPGVDTELSSERTTGRAA